MVQNAAVLFKVRGKSVQGKLKVLKPSCCKKSVPSQQVFHICQDSEVRQRLGRLMTIAPEISAGLFAFSQNASPSAFYNRVFFRWQAIPANLDGRIRMGVNPTQRDQGHLLVLIAKFIVVGRQLVFPLLRVLHVFIPALGFDNQVEVCKPQKNVWRDSARISGSSGISRWPILDPIEQLAGVLWQGFGKTGLGKNAPEHFHRQMQ